MKPTKIQEAKAEVKRLWILMCEEEGIPTNAIFVGFTSAGRYSAEYNVAIRKYQKLLRAKQTRDARKDAIASLGMKEVRGALGGRYIE